MTMDDLRRAFCDMAIEAVRETVLETEADGTAFYWYIAGGAEILRLAEKRAEEKEKENIIIHGGPEPVGKYL